jgi:peptidoglycan/xylan/chitin deacetylase (PgdA/CDA1 family)
MRIMALIYHDVSRTADNREGGADSESGADSAENWYRVRGDDFAAHLDAIEAASTSPSLVTEPASFDAVFLTFDDGDESAITTIAPMLESRGWRGHFFIVTGWIGTPGFVKDHDIRTLWSRGHVVGSHSHTHPIMTELTDGEIREEWRTSRDLLEEILNVPVETASIPMGYYSDRIGRLAIESGYRHVFTSEPWLRPRQLNAHTIYGRFSIRRATTSDSVRALCSFSRTVTARESVAWRSRKALKAVLGSRYEAVRRFVITHR